MGIGLQKNLIKVLKDGIQHEIDRIERAKAEIVKLQEELADENYDPTFEERQLWAFYTGQIRNYMSAEGSHIENPDLADLDLDE